MLLGRVVGRLWAARRAASLGGLKLLLVRPETATGAESRRLIVAVDGLDAGPGDRVLVAHGSRVRDITVGAAVADKDVIVGIVDGLALDDASSGAR
jgi:ethanolamine utilization protein EutN